MPTCHYVRDIAKKKVEETKGVIRNHKSKKDKQYIGQNKKNKQ
jgi:hypothetical protein